MTSGIHYQERVSSLRTSALFVGLCLAPLSLFVGRVQTAGFDGQSILLLALAAFFLFYSLNYRTLVIRVSPNGLRLRFGLFEWTIPLESLEACSPDPLSLWRVGGAGIHFTSVGRRYRAMFNFLEHPRLVVALKVKKGPVRDIAFSTRKPAELMRLLEPLIASRLVSREDSPAVRSSNG